MVRLASQDWRTARVRRRAALLCACALTALTGASVASSAPSFVVSDAAPVAVDGVREAASHAAQSRTIISSPAVADGAALPSATGQPGALTVTYQQPAATSQA